MLKVKYKRSFQKAKKPQIFNIEPIGLLFTNKKTQFQGVKELRSQGVKPILLLVQGSGFKVMNYSGLYNNRNFVA